MVGHYNTKGERDGVFKSFMPMAIKSRNSVITMILSVASAHFTTVQAIYECNLIA